MAVRDSHGYSGDPSQSQDKPAEVVNVAVQHVEGAVTFHRLEETPRVQRWIRRVGASQNPGPERHDFRVVRGRLVRMNQEIHVKSLPIDMPQDVHQPGFHAAAVHRSQHMKNAKRFHVMGAGLRVSVYRRIAMVAAS